MVLVVGSGEAADGGVEPEKLQDALVECWLRYAARRLLSETPSTNATLERFSLERYTYKAEIHVQGHC